MTDTDDLRAQKPCVNGCIRRGTEDDPSLLPATHGQFCSRCFGKLDNALRIAPDLIEHIISMVASHHGVEERVSGDGDAAPLPLSAQAFSDANELYSLLSYWARVWAEQLRMIAPAASARSWRTVRGTVVGLPANLPPHRARFAASIPATWISSHLDAILERGRVDDINEMIDNFRDVFRMNARWPREPRPRYSRMPCPRTGCNGRIAIYPPTTFEADTQIQCETCGLVLTEDRYEFYARLYAEMAAEQDKTKRHLLRKYAG